ncbi:MAG: twin-arginine translocation signal domain-containing protein [Anaerolineales bacterium]
MTDREPHYRGELSRRDFIKTAVFSGVALATAGLAKWLDQRSIIPVRAFGGAGPYYYGTDGAGYVSEYSSKGLPQNFYLGKTGAGLLMGSGDDSSFFVKAATLAGVPAYTHTYWELKGPYYQYQNPYYNTNNYPWNFGFAQGQLAASAFFNHPDCNYIGGQTIFADIELVVDKNNKPLPLSDPNSSGWQDDNGIINVNDNQQVVNGFIQGVTAPINGINYGFNPGIYTSLNFWNVYFNKYDPSSPIVVWLTGGPCIDCSPCDPNCSTTQTEVEAESIFETNKQVTLGTIYKTVIYQFEWNSGCQVSCSDFDISDQNGNTRFMPIINQGC